MKWQFDWSLLSRLRRGGATTWPRRSRLRCAEVVAQEHGCEQYEIFQGVANPDKLILMELWTEQADLDAHAELNKTRPPLPRELFAGGHRAGGLHL